MAEGLSLKTNLKKDLNCFVHLLLAEWKRKLFLSIVLNLVFIGLYFPIQSHALFPIKIIEPWYLDRFFLFDPRWASVYLSLFIFIGFGTLTIPHKKELTRFVFLFFGVFITAILFFLFLPTQIVRAEVATSNYIYEKIVFYDQPLNCFPSLHSSFCLITCFLFYRNSGEMYYKVFFRIFILIWSVLILVAILKIKQHYIVDMSGGLVNAVVWLLIVYRK